MGIEADLTRLVIADGAACVGQDPEDFFPIQAHEPIPDDIRDLCASCPRRRPCLAFALTHDVVGIWAGTNTARRVELRRTYGLAVIRRLRPVDRDHDDDQHPNRTPDRTADREESTP